MNAENVTDWTKTGAEKIPLLTVKKRQLKFWKDNEVKDLVLRSSGS